MTKFRYIAFILVLIVQIGLLAGCDGTESAGGVSDDGTIFTIAPDEFTDIVPDEVSSDMNIEEISSKDEVTADTVNNVSSLNVVNSSSEYKTIIPDDAAEDWRHYVSYIKFYAGEDAVKLGLNNWEECCKNDPVFNANWGPDGRQISTDISKDCSLNYYFVKIDEWLEIAGGDMKCDARTGSDNGDIIIYHDTRTQGDVADEINDKYFHYSVGEMDWVTITGNIKK